MIINHNISALNAHRQLGANQGATQNSLEKLSSGLRINKAGDDAAGLAISEKMRGQIRGLEMASKNAQDGISFIQTAEGALNETHSILQRMRELAVQSSNDTNTDADRAELQKEVDQLAEEITRIANNTEFNQKSLLNGAVSDNGEKAATFHIGANSEQNIELSINAMDAESLGVARTVTTTAGEIKSGSDIEGLELSDSVGSKVVDSAKITFKYETTSPEKGTTTGSAVVDSTLASGLNTKTLKFKVDDGAEKTVTFSSPTDIDAVISAINSEAGTTIADKDGSDHLILSTASTGSTSSLEITGGTALSDLGLDTEVITGTDGGAKSVTVSDGVAQKSFAITDETATTFTTGSDSDFGGLTINMASGKDISDLDSTGDEITMSVDTVTATAATFSGGEKTGDAVAKGGINISSQSAADDAITVINDAIETVSAERSKLGAYQNRLDHTINNLGTSAENLTAAESRIRDVDMAKEMMEFTKNNILSQAAQSMLAQSNQMPNGVLQLLQ